MVIFFHRFAGTLPFITLSTTSSVWMILMPWRNELQNICYLLYLDQFCLIYPNSLKPPTIWKLCRYDGILFLVWCFIFFYFSTSKRFFILQSQVVSRQDRLNSEKCQLDILVPNLLLVDTKKSTESMTLKYLPYQSLNNLFLTNDPNWPNFYFFL